MQFWCEGGGRASIAEPREVVQPRGHDAKGKEHAPLGMAGEGWLL